MKYTVVSENTSVATWAERLSARVEELSSKGYEPIGGVAFLDVPGSFQIACQTMVCATSKQSTGPR